MNFYQDPNPVLSLDGEWSLHHGNSADKLFPECDENHPIPAQVPGDVILDLMHAGLLPDPNYRDNYLLTQNVGKLTWILEKRFTIPTGDFSYEFVFDGLSLEADIFLNGRQIASHRNMHRELRIPVDFPCGGVQCLEVRLKPFDEKSLSSPVPDYWTGWSGGIYEKKFCAKRGAARKADYTYGWDWTQGLPSCGIWRSVRLECTEKLRIHNLYFRTAVSGSVDCFIELNSRLPAGEPILCRLELWDAGRKVLFLQKEERFTASPGEFSCNLKATLDRPKLWYPAGYGAQPLYEATVSFFCKDHLLAVKSRRIAFRKVELNEQLLSADQATFRFKVNGLPIFAKGVNWVPCDIIPGRITEEKYRHLLTILRDAQANYLRVWGGGIYEADLFYDLCDEYGIMVWQDFMFGGPEIAEFDPEFRQECLLEVEYNIRRLRNHPCIILFCGSNETDCFYDPNSHGFQTTSSDGHYFGWHLFHEDFPRLVSRLAPDTFYQPSCPCIGKFGTDGSFLEKESFGTVHRTPQSPLAPDSAYNSHKIYAFCNEAYGVSPAANSSLHKFLTEAELCQPDSPITEAHSIMELSRYDVWKCAEQAYGGFHEARREELSYREAFPMFHGLHSELIRRNVEYLRKNQDVAGGIAFWMFNSAWPGFDWSLVDYYGVPKPACFSFKRANAVLLPIAAIYPERVEGWLSNTSAKEFRGIFTLSLRGFDGRFLIFRQQRVLLDKASARCIITLTGEELSGVETHSCYVEICAIPESGIPIRNHRFFHFPGALHLPNTDIEIRRSLQEPDTVFLKSDGFASQVLLSPAEMENYPDDNAFDLYPGIEKRIKFRKAPEHFSIRWRNMPDTGPRLLSILKHSGVVERWELCIFNPSRVQTEFTLAVTAPACFVSAPELVQIPPGETRNIPVEFSINPLARRSHVIPIDIAIGKSLFKEASIAPYAAGLTGGVAQLHVLGKPCKSSAVLYQVKRRDGSYYEKYIPEMQLNPGETIDIAFSPPEELLPWTAEIRDRDGVLYRFIDDRSDLFQILPLKKFNGEFLPVHACATMSPDLMNEGSGVLIEPGEHVELLDPVCPAKMRAAVFLHRHENWLIGNVFFEGLPFEQPASHVSVWKNSCLEFLFGTADDRKYQDYSFSRTFCRCEAFLRREFGTGLSTGELIRKGISVDIIFGASPLLAQYKFAIDTAAVNLSEIFDDKYFKISMVFRGPGQRGMQIFHGSPLGKRLLFGGKAIAIRQESSPEIPCADRFMRD